MAADAAAAADTAQRNATAFFNARYFAVVGASNDANKFGHTVFSWYTQHHLPTTPINPNTATVEVSKKPYSTLPNLSALPHPTQTSVSFVTKLEQTLKVLKEAKQLGVHGVWFQPGSFDDQIMDYASKEFEVVVGGHHGTDAHDGWCVLVDGERYARAAHKL
ncbi:CoA binding domain-containing protein [Acephala macrosclerotiorum]|nr:CoA binding domain-containing protein [Acephala macrosclerotiorum]